MPVGMELPHLDVLHREARAQRHADAVAGIHQRIGRRRIDPSGPARRKNRCLRLDVDHLAALDLDCDHADDDTVLILHEVDREPLVQEGRLRAQVRLIEGVQQRVTGSIGRGARASRLPALAEVLRLPAERPLINAAGLGPRKRQPHVFEFVDRLRSDAAHVLDRILVADVVRPFDGVVHMPAPVVVGIVARDRAGDAALRRHRVRSRREYLRNHRGPQPRLRELQRGAHAGAAATDDHAIEFHLPNARHVTLSRRSAAPRAYR